LLKLAPLETTEREEKRIREKGFSVQDWIRSSRGPSGAGAILNTVGAERGDKVDKGQNSEDSWTEPQRTAGGRLISGDFSLKVKKGDKIVWMKGSNSLRGRCRGWLRQPALIMW